MKRFLSIAIVFCLLITLIPTKALADLSSEASLIIEDAEIPVVVSGKENTINFEVKNVGNSNAENVTMAAIFDEKGIFKINSLTSNANLPNIIQGKKISAKLDLSVSETAIPGDYPITLQFDYKYVSFTYPGPAQTNIGSQKITIYVRVSGQNTAPRLIVSSAKSNPDIINPGQNIKLNVIFENKGTIEAKGVTVKLEGLKEADGLVLTSGSDIGIIKKVRGNSVSNIVFDLKSSNKIKKGSHELIVTFSYNGISEPQKIYLNVGGDSSQASNLVLENLEHPTTAIKANNNFVLKFDLRNNGGMNAKDVLVKVESSDPAIINKTINVENINTIAVDGKKSLQFTFSPTEEADTKNYPLKITITYTDDLGEERTITQYAGMYVEKSGEDSTKGKPRLIIDKYSFNPQLVRAGENFEMTLSFYNTSSIKTVKNIKIFLTAQPGSSQSGDNSGSLAFTPVDSSNTFYIDSIPPKGKVEKTITMFTIPDAIAKTHTITANFEYEDNEGNELKDIELIGVPVVQNSRLETGELSYYPEAMVGQPMPISLEFYNTGKVTLYNMMVKLEGDFQTENGSTYIGNFVTGSSEYFEGMVIPSEPGELNGAVLFTYEDSTGQMQELRKEFTLNVMDMPPMEEYPGGEFPPMEEESGGFKGILKSKWLWISLVSIIAIVGGIIFYKKKKKAKEMAFDE